MKYTRFTIKNYKAIKEMIVNVANNIIPLIGINESGKTSILQAILAFDKSKDNLMDGIHTNPKNRYLTRQLECELIASILIENRNEYDELGNALKLSMDDSMYEWLTSKYENGEAIMLKRDYGNEQLLNTYSIINEPECIINHKKKKNLERELLKRLPNILYFDDFSDRVPNKVTFPENYIKDGKLSQGHQREWQEIIQEIFSRALGEEMSLQMFLQLEDEDDRANYLSDVTQTLNREIIAEWERLKKSNVESESPLEDFLSLKIDFNSNDGPTFVFKVVDEEYEERQRSFDINTRSKGFQWFFNFIMKLRFNPKYKEFPQNAIFLLDEPGSYLHSSAQIGLLNVLHQISKQNTILYCTHSQYLLDPDIINIGSIKIVSKEDGEIRLEDYGNAELSKAMGAFSAISHALQLKYGFIEKSNLGNCVLTEGITDYYLFRMILPIHDVTFIPGAGCGNLKDLISILIASSKRFLVVLDNDAEGRRAHNKYESYFGKAYSDNAYSYDSLDPRANCFVLENILSKSDRERLLDFTSSKDQKKAISILYYMDNRMDFLEKIDEETKRNIGIIEHKLKNHFFKV